MSASDIPHVLEWEDAALWVAARVEDIGGVPITQAVIGGITLKVFDLDDNGAVTLTQTLTVASVVFDTLQTPARWTADTTGYNFAYIVPASAFPLGNRRYRCEFVFDPTGGDNFPFVVDKTTRNLLSS